MPWNGSGVANATDGTFTGKAIWTQEKNAANLVTAAHFDTFTSDMLGMLQNCQTIDGQTTATIVNITATVNSNTGVITIGGVVLANLYGTNNIYLGGAGTFAGSGGSRNIGVGGQALATISGFDNVALGYQALANSGNTQQCVAIGTAALGGASAVATQNNVAIGFQTMMQCTANVNVFVGASCNPNGTGAGNTGIGNAAGAALTSGVANTFLGSGVSFVTSGSNNVTIGSSCQVPSATANGQLSIQNAIYGTGNTAIGSTPGTGKIGINNNAPTYTFDVLTGNVGVGTTGFGLRVKEGSNCKQGTATLSSGTVTVANTSVTTSSRILISGGALNASTAIGMLSVPTIIGATSFVITSYIPGGTATQTGDLRTVNYEIFEPY